MFCHGLSNFLSSFSEYFAELLQAFLMHILFLVIFADLATHFSFGCMSGPPLGSILYTFSGGMFMPQFSSGMLAVACGIVSISTIFSTSSSSTTISTEDSKSRFANRTKFKVPPQFNGSTNSLSATTHSQYSSFENTLFESLPPLLC